MPGTLPTDKGSKKWPVPLILTFMQPIHNVYADMKATRHNVKATLKLIHNVYATDLWNLFIMFAIMNAWNHSTIFGQHWKPYLGNLETDHCRFMQPWKLSITFRQPWNRSLSFYATLKTIYYVQATLKRILSWISWTLSQITSASVKVRWIYEV